MKIYYHNESRFDDPRGFWEHWHLTIHKPNTTPYLI